MWSSTPLKKEISPAVVLITQLGPVVCWKEWIEDISVGRGSSLTGKIVNWLVGIRKAPPLIDTSKEVPGYLYALFDYGLTIIICEIAIYPIQNSDKWLFIVRTKKMHLFLYFSLIHNQTKCYFFKFLLFNNAFINHAMYVAAVYLLCNIDKYSSIIDAWHGAFASIVSIKERKVNTPGEKPTMLTTPCKAFICK